MTFSNQQWRLLVSEITTSSDGVDLFAVEDNSVLGWVSVEANLVSATADLERVVSEIISIGIFNVGQLDVVDQREDHIKVSVFCLFEDGYVEGVLEASANG